jgi:adenylate cyclase
MAMMKRLVELNKRLVDKGWPILNHGIGIHTGEALAATIGSPDRLSYLLVGDTVNLASRLQSLTKEIGTELILSAVTHERLTETELADIELRRLPPTKIKGKREPVEVFAVA